MSDSLRPYEPYGSFVHEILQATILEWVAMLFSGGIFQPQGLNLHLLHPATLAGAFFTTSAIWEAQMYS